MKIKRSPFCSTKFIALSLGVQFAGLSYVYAGTYNWNNTGTDWNNGSSWTGGTAPTLTADVANFATAASTNPNLTSSLTITRVTASTTTDSSYTLSSSGPGVALTLLGTGTTTSSALNYSPTSGTFTISAPLIFGAAAASTQTINQVNAGGTISISGPISSTNSITLAKTGPGTLELKGANTYTGTTTVSGGTLGIGNNAALGTSSLTVSTGTTIRSTGAAAFTLANNVNWSNTIVTFGTGSTGNLTFGSLTGTGANKTVTVNNEQTTFSAYSNASNTIANGTGALVFTGNFSTTGTLIINNSMVAAGGTLSTTGLITLGGGVLGTNGTFTRSLGATATDVAWTAATNGGFAAYGGDLSVNLGNAGTPSTLTYGATNFVSSGSTLILSHAAATGTVDFRNSLDLAGAVQTVQVNNGSAAIDAKLTGTLSNGGVIKTGAGTLELTGTNLYAGGTTVSAGKLTIGSTGTINSTSGVSIGAGEFNYNSSTALSQGVSFSGTGGTLSGGGTITPAVTVSSGNFLSPGNSIGTLSFGTGLTIAGTYNAQLGTPGATPSSGLSDRAAVTGNLTLSGGTLILSDNAGADSNGSAGAGAYRLATYTGSLTGTFGSVTNPLSSTLHEVVSYGSGNVDLALYRFATATAPTASVDLGKVRVGTALTGSASITNSAASDGFSEQLKAVVTGNGTGFTSVAGGSSGTVNYSVATTASGSQSGSASVVLKSTGVGIYADTTLSTTNVSLSGLAYDPAKPVIAKASGDGTFGGSGATYTLDFGTGLTAGQTYTANLTLTNEQISSIYQDALSGTYGIAGAGFSKSVGASFSNLASAGTNSFSIVFTALTSGDYSGTFTLGTLRGNTTGLSPDILSDITIQLSGSVAAIPEPSSYAALLGAAGLGLAFFRRRQARR